MFHSPSGRSFYSFFERLPEAPLAVLLCLPLGVSAGDSIPNRSSGNTGFKAEQEVAVDKHHKGDLYLAGKRIEVDAPVDGDLIAAGKDIRVTGKVHSDLMAAAQKIELSGSVGDDMRSFASELKVSGRITGDLLVFGGELELTDGSVVEGLLKVYGGKVTLEGTVKGNVDIAGGELDHRGTIEGDLKARTGLSTIQGDIGGKSILASKTLKVKDGASFQGDVKYWRRKGKVDLGPYLKGGESDLDPALKDRVMGDVGWSALLFGFWIAWSIYILSSALVLFLLNHLLTRSFQRAGIALVHIGKSLGYGALYVFGLPIASLLLLITLIGAPIGLVAGMLWGLSMLFTHLLSAVVITHWLKMRYNKAWDRTYLFLVSLLIYFVLKGISTIPILGALFSIFIIMACFGAILLARRALFTNRPMVRI